MRANDANSKLFIYLQQREGCKRGWISKPFAQSVTKGGDNARVMVGLSKWAWRGRQKPIKWTAVELINNRNIKCHVNFISRVGGLIKTQVKRGVEEFIGIEDHMACLWHRLLINASRHSGPSGSTFSKQYRSWLRNTPFFFVPVSIFGLFFFLLSPLLFFFLRPNSSLFPLLYKLRPPDKRLPPPCQPGAHW